ncbi:MAG: GNAT family N-acetyltransferase [Cytophagales bacterium]|nr:GNAT family N-acetyltransferase [Cytophagales bacterium]
MSKYLFTSERLGFRDWLDKDYAPFAAMNQDKEVMKYFPKTLTESESAQTIERFKKQFSRTAYTFFAVDLLDTEEFLGFIGLYDTTFESYFTPCVEIGWRLKKDSWNQGIATEGALACLHYAKNETKLNEIFSFTSESNLPSQRVMQKIGMKHMGCFLHPKLPSGHALESHVLYKAVLE